MTRAVKNHGLSSSAEYQTLQRVRGRCLNPENPDYVEYGARGITICERWLEDCGKGFLNFLEDMGERPEGKTLDRINVDGNYEPSNCRWATPQTQAYNQRPYKCSKSGKVGVTWNKKSSKWEARISKDCKEIYLGFFPEFKEAVKAREDAEIRYYGYLKHGSYFDNKEYNQ